MIEDDRINGNLKKISRILFGIFLIFLACKDENLELVPQQFILGKWELVELGNWPNMEPVEPSGYTEFLQDSVSRFFDYELNSYDTSHKYWVTDSLLIRSFTRQDGYKLLFQSRYGFQRNFLQGDKMRLDIIGTTSIFSTSIFQRID